MDRASACGTCSPLLSSLDINKGFFPYWYKVVGKEIEPVMIKIA